MQITIWILNMVPHPFYDSDKRLEHKNHDKIKYSDMHMQGKSGR